MRAHKSSRVLINKSYKPYAIILHSSLRTLSVYSIYFNLSTLLSKKVTTSTQNAGSSFNNLILSCKSYENSSRHKFNSLS